MKEGPPPGGPIPELPDLPESFAPKYDPEALAEMIQFLLKKKQT
ncbi:hypothetical protein [Brockia lithotrophica]|uniref:Uncharacterized protein n=1 Tax=Brockia lithotrophica TaxID=933949 RepID=A0A660KZL0_9BACL|nr:hypothetical protein [Brockia lithotrophica]RKQ84122.1 hypothetical protein C7438_1290 [Brockia lithotrophica]